MHELIALVMDGSPAFVDALRRAWDAGDAVLPVDPRLPQRAQETLVRSMGVARVVDADGAEHHLDGGRPV